jgi:hypothetical protein
MKNIQVDESQASFFESDLTVIACVGPMAATAMFRLNMVDQQPSLWSLLNQQQAKWSFLEPHSPEYDSYHQSIFRNGRATSLSKKMVEHLPALPAEVSYEPQSREDYYRPARGIHANDYPALKKILLEQPLESCPIYLVLKEDMYETSCGDGCYRYLDSAHLDQTEADMAASTITATSGYQGHLRQITITLIDEHLDAADFTLAVFEHYSITEVLGLLNDRIGKADLLGKIE